MNAACDDISVSISVGDNYSTSETAADINNVAIAKGNSAAVSVTITYAEGGDRADGGFDVTFGDIVLTFSSAD